MFRMFMIAMAMVSMVGCAAKASSPTVQEQLDAHVVEMTKAHQEMDAKNAEQDAAIAEINAKLNRAFVKGH